MALPIIVYGPTASGKSAYGVRLAKELDGEVINCDARQVYQGMAVGTGVITTAEMEGVVHHLLQFRDPAEPYNVALFLEDAGRVEKEVRERGKLPIYVGGTGLYVQALMEGIQEGLASDPELRAALEERELEDLVAELRRVDPDSTVDPRNKRYVVRALEIWHTSGGVRSQLQPGHRADYDLRAILRPLPELYKKINSRHAEMFLSGALQQEVARLEERAVDEEVWKTIGYPQARALLHGNCTLEAAIEQTQVAARHYAKRQMTWLRRMEGRLPVHVLTNVSTL